MNCPACKNAMITLELADVEIDYCARCGGTWLDAGEIEVLLDDPPQARGLLDSFQEDPATAEYARNCPICDKRMVKVIVGRSPPPLLIDKCRYDHGLWFDRGELQEVLRRGRLDEDSRILRLLTDIFGKDREKSGAEQP